jgi:hypothetical protein
MEAGARAAIDPAARMEIRMAWAINMEGRIKEGQIASMAAIVIANATEAARDDRIE